MKILVPTDFSDHAQSAMAYAVRLANVLLADLHIIHCYVPRRRTGSFKSLDVAIRVTAEEDMKLLHAGLVSTLHADAVVQTEVIQGFPDDVIPSVAKQHKIDLIVMGTQGTSNIMNVLLGSVTKEIFHNSEVPVLAIPANGIELAKRRRVLLAVDANKIDESPSFKVLRALTDALETTIDVLHIKKHNEPKIDFDPFVAHFLGTSMGEFYVEEGANATNAIFNFVIENEIGILAMIRRKHSFMQKLFFEQHTDDSLSNLTVPLFLIPS